MKSSNAVVNSNDSVSAKAMIDLRQNDEVVAGHLL